MAYSYITYTGDGELTNYSVTFPYLQKSHVKVYVQGLLKTDGVHYSWLNSGVIQFSTAPSINEVVFLMRDTGRDARLVDFQTGSLLSEAMLDLDSNQLFYLMQEAFDWIVKAGDTNNTIFMDQQSILNAITGEISQDFLTGDFVKPINYLQDYWLSDAVFEESVYEYGVHAQGTARIDLMENNIDLIVADTAGHTGMLSLMAQEMFVKLDNNGNVAGFGIYNDEEGSAFVVNADYFAIVNADDPDDIQYPFVVDVDSGLVGVDGNLMVTGSITGDKVAANTIEASNIAAGTITANEIAVGGVGGTNIANGAISTDHITAATITGAKIAATTIEAGNIAAGAITTTKLQVGSVDDTIIASGAVTTQKVAANAISATHIGTNEIVASAANIKNAVITGAKIGNAQVDSLQIKGQAVTIPVSAYTEANQSVNNGSYVTIQSCAITATGNPIFINVSAMLTYVGESFMAIGVKILRGSTTIYTAAFSMNNNESKPYAASLSDTPSAGSYTYYLQVMYVTGTDLGVKNRSILLLEVKR